MIHVLKVKRTIQVEVRVPEDFNDGVQQKMRPEEARAESLALLDMRSFISFEELEEDPDVQVQDSGWEVVEQRLEVEPKDGASEK